MQFLIKIKSLLGVLVNPIARSEDRARREFILNILLTVIIGFSSVTFLINLVKLSAGVKNLSVSPITILIILSFFIGLYFLSRKGLSNLASYLLLTTFFAITTLEGYIWVYHLPFYHMFLLS